MGTKTGKYMVISIYPITASGFYLKGPVEKGRKWRFEVKIEIAPI